MTQETVRAQNPVQREQFQRLHDELVKRRDAGTLLPPSLKLRKTQRLAIDALIDFCGSHAKGDSKSAKTFIEAATGVGKTAFYLLLADVAKTLGMKMVVFTPFNDLQSQAVKDGETFAPNVRVGMYNQDTKDSFKEKDLLIVSYQSGGGFLMDNVSHIPLVIYDEVHTALTKPRLGLWERIKKNKQGLLAIGLTGSPIYNALKHVALYFGKPILSRPTRVAIKDGELCGVQTMSIQTTLELDEGSDICPNGELSDEGENKIIQDSARNKLVIDLLGHPDLKGIKKIVSCVNTKHADVLAEGARQAGHNVGVMHSKDDTESKKAYAAAREGTIDVLFVVNKTVGLDFPKFGCMIAARPTGSWPFATQRLGRVLRKDASNPDKIALHIDIIDRRQMHSRKPDKRFITAMMVLGSSVLLNDTGEGKKRSSDKAVADVFLAQLKGDQSLSLPAGFKVGFTVKEQASFLGDEDGDSAAMPVAIGDEETTEIELEESETIALTTLEDIKILVAKAFPTFESLASKMDRSTRNDLANLKCGGYKLGFLARYYVSNFLHRVEDDNVHRAVPLLLGDLFPEYWRHVGEVMQQYYRAAEEGTLDRLFYKLVTTRESDCTISGKRGGLPDRFAVSGMDMLFMATGKPELAGVGDNIISEEGLSHLCDFFALSRGKQEELLLTRERAEVITRLDSEDALIDLLKQCSGVQRLSRRAFCEQKFVDPESAIVFTGQDVLGVLIRSKAEHLYEGFAVVQKLLGATKTDMLYSCYNGACHADDRDKNIGRRYLFAMEKLALDAGGRKNIQIPTAQAYVANPLYSDREPIPVEILQVYVAANDSDLNLAGVLDLPSGLTSNTLVSILTNNQAASEAAELPLIIQMSPAKMLDEVAKVDLNNIANHDISVSEHLLSCCREVPDWVTVERKREIASVVRRFWLSISNLAAAKKEEDLCQNLTANINQLAKIVSLQEGKVYYQNQNILRQLVAGEDTIFVAQRKVLADKESIRIVELIESAQIVNDGTSNRQLLFHCREEGCMDESPKISWTDEDLQEIYLVLREHFALTDDDTICFDLPSRYETTSSDALPAQIIILPRLTKVECYPRYLRGSVGLGRLRSVAFCSAGIAGNTTANFIADFLEVEAKMKDLMAKIDIQVSTLSASDTTWESIQKLAKYELELFSREEGLVRVRQDMDRMGRFLDNRRHRATLLAEAITNKDLNGAILSFLVTFGDLMDINPQEMRAAISANIEVRNEVVAFLLERYCEAIPLKLKSFKKDLDGVIAGYSMQSAESGLLPVTSAERLMGSSPYFSPAADLLIFLDHSRRIFHMDPVCNQATAGSITTALPHPQAFKDHAEYVKCSKCRCPKSAEDATNFVANFRRNLQAVFDRRIIQPGPYPPPS